MTRLGRTRTTKTDERPEIAADGRSLVEGWFASKGWTPWQFQRDAWDAYARGESGLIQVPTGAGKTYAAYLGGLAEQIDSLRAASALGGPTLRILYITPLRAVSRDIELALRAPIEALGMPFLVESRTGDTKQSVRAKQRDRLPEVLITTPESLSVMLTRPQAGDLLSSCRLVVIDEWHELVSTKRGSQTELALARLRRFAPGLRTWGLSATLPNATEAAHAAIGVASRSPTIITAAMEREVILDSVLPSAGRLPWAGHMGLAMLPDVVAALDPAVPTLVFTNTRSQAERWYHAMLVARPEWADVAALHHGSIDREERERVEAGLKDGSLRLVVATSSLDLGVDFSPVERVVQIGSPKGISRLLQRAGRASHRPRVPCRVTCVPTHALELVEIAAARQSIAERDIETRTSIDKPLDVLAQHLVTCGLGGGFTATEMFAELRTAWSFRTLSEEEFGWAIQLVKQGGAALGAYPDFQKLREENGRYTCTTARIAQLHRLNIGTITGDTSIDIRYVGGRSLGRIEEHFVAHLKTGERFVFAGRVLEFVQVRDLTALVRPARGTTTNTPIWGGTRLPISESLAGSIRATLERARNGDRTVPELAAADSLIGVQQRESAIPGHEELLVELTETPDGAHLFVFPFEGRLVHAGIGALLALRLSRLRPATLSIAANDYGFEILCPDATFPYESLLGPGMWSRDNLSADAVESVNISELARLQFREVARVAGLVFQTYPGAKKSGRQLQAGAGLLFDVLTEFDPDNLLLKQARKEVLDRHFEASRLARTLDRLAASRLIIRRTKRPTPLSFPLIIERLSARLSSETIADRVERMRKQWELDLSTSNTPTGQPKPSKRRPRGFRTG